MTISIIISFLTSSLLLFFFWLIRKNILKNPSFYIVVMVYGLNTVGGLCFAFFDFAYGRPEVPFFYDNFIYAQLVTLFSLLLFVFSYFIACSVIPNIKRIHYSATSLKLIFKSAKLIFFVSLFFFVFSIVKSFGFFEFIKNYAMIRSGLYPGDAGNYGALTTLSRAILLIAFYFLIGGNRRHGISIWMKLFSFFIAFLTVLSTAGRGTMILFFAVTTVCYLVSKGKKLKFWYVLMIILIAIPIALGGRYILNPLTYLGYYGDSLSIIVATSFGWERLTQQLGVLVSPLAQLGMVIDYVKTTENYYMFKDWLYTPIYLTPMALHGIKPEGAQETFTKIFFPALRQVPAGFLGYTYWSFGLLGIFFVSLLLGIVIRFYELCLKYFFSNQALVSALVYYSFMGHRFAPSYAHSFYKHVTPLLFFGVCTFCLFCFAKEAKKLHNLN